MSLFSVDDDFVRNTLNAVPGVWGKLRYLSSLRRPEGQYEHWGLIRRYGENAVQSAILDAHRKAMFQVLRTPLPELLEETKEAANQNEVSLREYVDRLAAESGVLLPLRTGAGSVRHFMTVLQSLSYLAQGYMDANRQAS